MQQQTKTALEEYKKHSIVGGILSYGILSGHPKKISYRKQIVRQHLCHKKNRPKLGTGEACKDFPFIKFDHRAKFGCYVSYHVSVNVEGPKTFGDARPAPLAMAAWLTASNTALPIMFALRQTVCRRR